MNEDIITTKNSCISLIDKIITCQTKLLETGTKKETTVRQTTATTINVLTELYLIFDKWSEELVFPDLLAKTEELLSIYVGVDGLLSLLAVKDTGIEDLHNEYIKIISEKFYRFMLSLEENERK